MTEFTKAVPIWVKDKQNEIHYRAQFKTFLNYSGNSSVELLIATSGIYNLFVNGFVCTYTGYLY